MAPPSLAPFQGLRSTRITDSHIRRLATPVGVKICLTFPAFEKKYLGTENSLPAPPPKKHI